MSPTDSMYSSLKWHQSRAFKTKQSLACSMVSWIAWYWDFTCQASSCLFQITNVMNMYQALHFRCGQKGLRWMAGHCFTSSSIFSLEGLEKQVPVRELDDGYCLPLNWICQSMELFIKYTKWWLRNKFCQLIHNVSESSCPDPYATILFGDAGENARQRPTKARSIAECAANCTDAAKEAKLPNCRICLDCHSFEFDETEDEPSRRCTLNKERLPATNDTDKLFCTLG